MTTIQLAQEARVAKNTVANIEHHVALEMQEENAKRLAKALGVSLDEIVNRREREVRNPAVGALGLYETEWTADEATPFQNYVYDRENQPLALQWQDSRTEKLVLSYEQHPAGEMRLVATFEGSHVPMASNFALHPQRLRPRALTGDQRSIGFAVKLIDRPGGAPVTLAVRVVDRRARAWVYALNRAFGDSQPALFEVDGAKKWTPCIVPLESLLPQSHWWSLFTRTSADRAANLRPDFSAVSRIVIEVGTMSPTGHPSAGNGQLWFSPIWVGSPTSILSRLPTDHREGLKTARRKPRAKPNGGAWD